MLTIEQTKNMFASAAAKITAAEAELCALDAVCGDGDHGIAIKGAINAANEAFQSASNIKDAFYDAGFAAMSHSNGSTSTLFGALLMGVSEAVPEGLSKLDADAVAKAFEGGLNSVKDNTKARVGDKTLMDALIPAVEAMARESDEKLMFKAAAEAARKGAESTKQLQAKFGRARNLGEKSVGSTDAGATSTALMFEAFSEALE